MSNAFGACRFSDGLIMYFVYSGTGDFCFSALTPTLDEAWPSANYFNRLENDDDVRCHHDPEPVEIYSDYGRGFYWQGTACRHCACLIDYDWRGDWCPYSGRERKAPKDKANGRPSWFGEMGDIWHRPINQ